MNVKQFHNFWFAKTSICSQSPIFDGYILLHTWSTNNALIKYTTEEIIIILSFTFWVNIN